jgi:hypothetical protein
MSWKRILGPTEIGQDALVDGRPSLAVPAVGLGVHFQVPKGLLEAQVAQRGQEVFGGNATDIATARQLVDLVPGNHALTTPGNLRVQSVARET